MSYFDNYPEVDKGALRTGPHNLVVSISHFGNSHFRSRHEILTAPADLLWKLRLPFMPRNSHCPRLTTFSLPPTYYYNVWNLWKGKKEHSHCPRLTITMFGTCGRERKNGRKLHKNSKGIFLCLASRRSKESKKIKKR